MKTNDLFPLTGYTEDKKFAIYGDDFSFTFMENKQSSFNLLAVEKEDDLIRGYSHEGNQIAITCENEFEISGRRRLNTYCIFKSANPIEEKVSGFNKITFTGGMLNTLFRRHSLDIDHEQKGLGIKVQNDSVIYSFECNGENISIEIWSAVSWSSGWQEGTRIKNTDVNLSICFTEKKPFSFAILCYQYICDCIRFMMNRSNVGFDTITISTVNHKDDCDQYRFNVFFREDYQYTEKDGHRCITFDCLGESFIQLYLLFATSTNSYMNYSFGFFPKDDRDVYSITNSTIRSICAALEFEAEKEVEVHSNSSPAMKELITSTKKHIKEFRKTHEGISSSTYDNIFTSIGFWSFSAKDKIQILWNIHKSAMDVLTHDIQRYYSLDISTFVKYRNNITHGAEMQPSEEVAAITYALRGLVYCCVLKRIGIKEEEIIELCQHQINK